MSYVVRIKPALRLDFEHRPAVQGPADRALVIAAVAGGAVEIAGSVEDHAN